MKTISKIYPAPVGHWVGDGFPVRSLFAYNRDAELISPFLLLDYAGPADFPPAQRPRGVGEHPHRGFETVTIVYSGEVSHRDSTGRGGTIGPGDVQWMTAGAGILHEEFHSEAFTRSGGRLEMVQLWVNLPAKDKLATPGYQAILSRDIPSIALPGNAGTLRLIAGKYANQTGPAHTYTPLNLWDIRLTDKGSLTLPIPDGWNAAIVLLHGDARIGNTPVEESQTVLFSRSGSNISVETDREASLLLMAGEPIDEPIAGHGPFVMNTQQQIAQAIADFRSGHFGEISE